MIRDLAAEGLAIVPADALAALSRESAARKGFVLVPAEATPAMCEAVAFGSYTTFSYGGDAHSFEYLSAENAADVWRDMIAAHLSGLSREGGKQDQGDAE